MIILKESLKLPFRIHGQFKKKINSLYCQQNAMSQYPDYFIKPIYKKDIQKEMVKTGEAQKLSHVPTRAALNNETSSLSHDALINKIINYCMKDGKKELARLQVEKTLENIKRLQIEKYHKCENEEEKQKIELNPKVIVHKAIENCKPILELTPIKRGGVKYQVPVPITDKRSTFRSVKWLIEAGKTKESDTRFYQQFARELINAANETGRVIKRKQELHKQCEANRAYAHYRWS